MTIELSENVKRLLPADIREAEKLANAILEDALEVPPELRLANRPDWQDKYFRAQEDVKNNRLHAHEDVVRDWAINPSV